MAKKLIKSEACGDNSEFFQLGKNTEFSGKAPFFIVQGLDDNDSIVDFKPLDQIKGKGGITELDIHCLEAIVELAGDSYTDVQEVENHTGYKLQSIRNFATKLAKQEGGLLVAHALSD